MRTVFKLRIEYADGHMRDTLASGEDVADAKLRWQQINQELAPFEWHGAVCFVQGAEPAEERAVSRTHYR